MEIIFKKFNLLISLKYNFRGVFKYYQHMPKNLEKVFIRHKKTNKCLLLTNLSYGCKII